MFASASKNGLALLLVTALVGSGCLSSTYRVPRSELQSLAQTPPAERGKQVRVVQNVGDADDPPAATRVESHTTIILVGDVHGGGHSHGGGGGGGGGSGVRPGGGKGPSAKLANDDSKAWIILAVAVAIGLAATEGARYDGWVGLHPMHPVHLFGPYGEYMVVPLAQLTPEQAAWASKGVIRETEGPWQELGRAPLNRAGFTYSLFFGQAAIPSAEDGVKSGFQSHIQFGYFPAKQFGLQLDFGLGWRNNEMDLQIFDGRYSIEAQVFPVSAGAFHAGVFGDIGLATHIEDGGPTNRDESGNLFGGGVLAQLELTTRLAITGRAGYIMLMGEGVTELSLGLSIY